MSDAQDRTLPLTDRVRLRVHLHWCVTCTRYRQQLEFMRKALRYYSR